MVLKNLLGEGSWYHTILYHETYLNHFKEDDIDIDTAMNWKPNITYIISYNQKYITYEFIWIWIYQYGSIIAEENKITESDITYSMRHLLSEFKVANSWDRQPSTNLRVSWGGCHDGLGCHVADTFAYLLGIHVQMQWVVGCEQMRQVVRQD